MTVTAGKTEARRPRVQSAARAIAILVAVAQSEDGLNTRQISEQVGIGRQATYHLLHTLLGTGMLTRDEHNRYLLGFRVGTLAEGFVRQLAPSEHLGPIVRALAKGTGETAFASGWWSGEIMS
jgi:IclR family acetate operon transcriptional repressor